MTAVVALRAMRIESDVAAVPSGGFIMAMRVILAALMGVLGATLAPPSMAATQTGSCDSAAVVAHALSAVVNISVVKVIGASKEAGDEATGEHFEISYGSGVIIDPSGIIVTNKHVIQDAALIRVIFQDRLQAPAQLVSAASLVDLAVLKVAVPEPLPTLTFANSDAVQVGEPVLAVGNPLGLGTSVSKGVVSALNRDLMRTPFDDFIQTDASINPGNSGGPLIDCTGKIVGIDTELLSNNKLLGSIGLGFALPANDVSYVTGKLRDPDSPELPTWIGMHLQDLTSRLAVVFGRPDIDGAIVTGVEPDSPAAHASLVAGDIITAVNGKDLSDSRAILRAVVSHPTEEPIVLSVWRHGQPLNVSVRGEPWPHLVALRGEVLASPDSIAKAEAVGLGLHVRRMTLADRRVYGLKGLSGVVIDRVKAGSQAENVDLHPGDVIEQVGDKPATGPTEVMADLAKAQTASGDLVALLVHEQTGSKWITLYVGQLQVGDLIAGPLQPKGRGQVHDVQAHAP